MDVSGNDGKTLKKKQLSTQAQSLPHIISLYQELCKARNNVQESIEAIRKDYISNKVMTLKSYGPTLKVLARAKGVMSR